MFYSYFYKISFRILKNHRFYKKTGASWFYYHSHSCTTFNLCISSACLRPNLMPLALESPFSFSPVVPDDPPPFAIADWVEPYASLKAGFEIIATSIVNVLNFSN